MIATSLPSAGRRKMRADNTEALRAATRQRAEATRDRARAALLRLESSGVDVTFQVVAREARVSRAWLYADPEFRQAVEQLRSATTGQARARRVPVRQRSSEAGLLSRLEAANLTNRRLTEENQRLRQELELCHGANRVARRRSKGDNNL